MLSARTEKYILLITEKPDAAKRIATALDINGNPKKKVSHGVTYYQAFRDGNIIVVPSLGHLYAIASKQKGYSYPVFDYKWVPRYQIERKASRIRILLRVIAQLAKNAYRFVDACDFDIEGSIIGYNILKYTCKNKQETAKRMKYSTLTKEELQESYSHLLPKLDFSLIEAGLTRHEVDWLFGINLSRALTQAAKSTSGQYYTLSTGRVQGPTLRFLETRERKINCFVPTPYWTLTAKIQIDHTTIEAEYDKTIETIAQAYIIKDACKSDEGKIVSVGLDEFEQNPPVPFDLGGLQSEAYRIFKYSPLYTLTILQRLYLYSLISYPRTSSQKLPPSINYKSILQKIGERAIYKKQVLELLSKATLKPYEGIKDDPAHPAIYPTGNEPEKSTESAERNLLDLIVKRFLAVFGEPAIIQRTKVVININKNSFYTSSSQTKVEGWLRFYRPYVQSKQISLPLFTEGQRVDIKQIILNEHFTKPPARYNPRSLLLKMEKEDIGTEATRGKTIQTLHDRNYMTGKDHLYISDLGFEVTKVLLKYCPTVISPELTRKLEGKMNEIQQGKQTKRNVLKEATNNLKLVISVLKENESAIGTQLSSPLKKLRLIERTIGACPKCIGGKLLILHSKKTGKRFVGCTNFFEGKCNTAFPLPQTGKIKPTGIICRDCGSPIVAVCLQGTNSRQMCLNLKCRLRQNSNEM